MLQLAPVLTLSNLDDHMIPIEGGVFEMGGSEHRDERPIHKVLLNNFALCRYPVSQQLWYEVMGKNVDRMGLQNPHLPVVGPSWIEITRSFLPRLHKKTGLISYCLPTEAQWEYAARGGKYVFGQAGQQSFLFANSNAPKEVGWYRENSHSKLHPAALKRPNALGLYDMSGNVFEWCQDQYAEDYYQALQDQYGDQPALNPVGPDRGRNRLIRGGSYLSEKDSSSVTNRSFADPLNSYGFVGFRLCRYSEAAAI